MMVGRKITDDAVVVLIADAGFRGLDPFPFDVWGADMIGGLAGVEVPDELEGGIESNEGRKKDLASNLGWVDSVLGDGVFKAEGDPASTLGKCRLIRRMANCT
jgi:hypothetical protein